MKYVKPADVQSEGHRRILYHNTRGVIGHIHAALRREKASGEHNHYGIKGTFNNYETNEPVLWHGEKGIEVGLVTTVDNAQKIHSITTALKTRTLLSSVDSLENTARSYARERGKNIVYERFYIGTTHVQDFNLQFSSENTNIYTSAQFAGAYDPSVRVRIATRDDPTESETQDLCHLVNHLLSAGYVPLMVDSQFKDQYHGLFGNSFRQFVNRNPQLVVPNAPNVSLRAAQKKPHKYLLQFVILRDQLSELVLQHDARIQATIHEHMLTSSMHKGDAARMGQIQRRLLEVRKELVDVTERAHEQNDPSSRADMLQQEIRNLEDQNYTVGLAAIQHPQVMASRIEYAAQNIKKLEEFKKSLEATEKIVRVLRGKL